MLGGSIKIDETYNLGNKKKNKRVGKRTSQEQGRSTKIKAVAFGISKRHGETKAFYVPSTKTKSKRLYRNIMP